MQRLSASVGLGGKNQRPDVRLAQQVLTSHGVSPGPIDGKFGRRTLSAIVAFQRRFLAQPDGRIDLNGATWHHLFGRTGNAGLATPPSTLHQSPPIAASPPAQHQLDYRHPLPLPPRDTINVGLSSPSNTAMRAKLGEPRSEYDQQCRPPTDPRIKAAVTALQVGQTRVSGLRPAVESLRQIMNEIQLDLPDLYARLGSAGMMCCRNVRGSQTSVSNHSWGTAVDLTIVGHPEPRGERDVWMGLSLVAPYFNRHGWYWGAAFHTTDAHHFECGSALIAAFSI